MKLLKYIAASALAVAPIAVQAESIVAGDGKSIANFFENEGASVELSEDNVGDPFLEVEHYGTDFSIYFYGCTGGTDCDSIQFFSGYRTEGAVRIVKANEWNADNQYSRAYISDSGSARIEHDVYLGRNGMHPDDFATLVSKWASRLREFDEFIDW
jgi:hypothetical protein